MSEKPADITEDNTVVTPTETKKVPRKKGGRKPKAKQEDNLVITAIEEVSPSVPVTASEEVAEEKESDDTPTICPPVDAAAEVETKDPAPVESSRSVIARLAVSDAELRKAIIFLQRGKTVGVQNGRHLVFSSRPPHAGGLDEIKRQYGASVVLV